MNGDEATAKVLATLDELNVAYMLVGSFSTNIYGIARSTHDADIVVQLGNVSIHEIADRLRPEIVLDPQMAFESVTATMRYIFNVAGIPFQIEFFRLSNDPHDQQRFDRRRSGFSPQLQRVTYFPTAEDVIVTKLRWAAQAGRPKDHEDLRNVVGVQGDALDWSYIHTWCEQHGTRGLLDTIRQSIPPIV